MNNPEISIESRDDQTWDDLLALQEVEGQQDDGLMQMFSTSSCGAVSCC